MTSPCCNAALAQKWAYWLDGWKVELLVCGLCRKFVQETREMNWNG